MSRQQVARLWMRGFTLLELLVVLVVLGMLFAIMTPQVMNMLSGAKSDTVGLQIETLGTALHYYKLDAGTYPSTEQGLAVLWQRPKDATNWRGPYIRKKQHLLDPWGREYLYKYPGRKGPFDLYSLGADGKEGGSGEDADVGNWQD
ncbi:MAG: type II secretion system major pseudopilin GspG [Syntrophobacteraceae bacterium]|nr:type II secretion system major pseudopilin GspG [Syntrophobacteraceae bacterium]